jgi:serine/threonine protein kinase
VRTSDPDEQRILRLTEQLLDILEIAHAHGIVHGAISPENVLVTPRGSTRLVDFSVPPGLGSRKDDESPLAELRIGPYTPPERCGPSHLSAATEQGDVWSTGAIMYYALTGTPPRGDASTAARLASEKPKPIRDVRPETSEHVANVIDHALEQDPAVRYDSAYAMLGDVRRVLAGRKPKLAQSSGPVPSGVLADSSGGPPSTFRPPPFRSTTAPTGGSARKQAGGSQWRGNVSLIVLIAAILAAATYVMVREKAEEQERGAPATSPS